MFDQRSKIRLQHDDVEVLPHSKSAGPGEFLYLPVFFELHIFGLYLPSMKVEIPQHVFGNIFIKHICDQILNFTT